MSRTPFWLYGLLAASAALGALALLWVRIAPRARGALSAVRVQRGELDTLAARAEEERTGRSTESEAARLRAEKAEQGSQKLASQLAFLDPTIGAPPLERAAVVDELASRLGRPPSVLEPFLPELSLPATEASFRLATVRDLLLAASEAGVTDVRFVVFPRKADDAAEARFGPWLETRTVRIEYSAGYTAHRALLRSLVDRRERGPFYTLDSVDVARGSAVLLPGDAATRPANPNFRPEAPEAVVARVELRRVIPTLR